MASNNNHNDEEVLTRKYHPLKQSEASDDIVKGDFIETYKVKQAKLQREGFLFASWLVRRGLHTFAQKIACVGSNLETSLNVLSNKTNFVTFLKNLCRGKIAGPSKDSRSYLSFVGLLDQRLDLDKNLEASGSDRYFASISAMASKLAYENRQVIKNTVENRWKMKLVGPAGTYNFWDEKNQKYSTQCFIFHDDTNDSDTIFIAFRGTEVFNAYDWSTDFNISWHELKGTKGKVHDGFMKALGLQLDGSWPVARDSDDGDRKCAYPEITKMLKAHLKGNTRFVVTGHSLGGALAILYPSVLAVHGEARVLERLEAVYTFGQPRVGDERFSKFMTEQFASHGIRYRRFVYNNDIVPRLPYDDLSLMFKHFGTCVYVDSNYEAQVVEEVPYKNYVDPRAYVPMWFDSLWELVRSFLIPRMFGPDYKEGVLQRMGRVAPVLIPFPLLPGMVDHGPQDYVNATRLADY